MENPYQLNFIQRLKQMLPANVSLAEELISVLELSQDSAYRRIRGDTTMSVDEAIQLCNHYKIPIAYFTDEIPGLVNFKYIPPENKKESFYRHLQMIYNSADELLDHDNRKIIHAAIDVPLFQHFEFEKLTQFKMHFWMHVILGIDQFKKFYDTNDIDRDFISLAKKIHENYLLIPSEEIWPEDIMRTTIKQIEYYWDLGYFKEASDAIDILEQLNVLTDHAEAMATISHKLKYGDKSRQTYAEFTLYQCDVVLGNNTILTIADTKKTSYIGHMSFNAMITNSENYAQQTENWLKKIISKSNLISGSSEKNRIKYFRNLKRYIEGSIEKIKSTYHG